MGSMQCIGRMDMPGGGCRVYYLRERHALLVRVAAGERTRSAPWHCMQRLPRACRPARRAQLAIEADCLVVRWRDRGRKTLLTLPLPSPEAPLPPAAPALLERTARNPILQPRPDHDWEGLAVFNAAALPLEGRVHFIYRAVGYDGLSVFGHAASSDGVNIDERSEAPVFVDTATPQAYTGDAATAQSDYCSGPGHCGSEDPRLTHIGDTIFMTYTAFDGRHPPGVALTSIAVDDFVAKRWNWKPPVLISALHEAHKNWVLFPKQIAGRYAVLHGISPGIMIDFKEGLDFADGACIASRYACSGRDDAWDSRMRGAGPPPIYTPAGWLLLYHAMDRRDPGRYKLGAMLLDLNDPTHILGRLPHPLLQPDARYENDGLKAGVVYACGAALIDDLLHVYYGGADTVVCAATVSLARLLVELRPAVPRARPTFHRWRPHATAHARLAQSTAVGQQGIALGTDGRVQSQRRPARGGASPCVPGTVRAR